MASGLKLTKKNGGLQNIKYIEVIKVFSQYKYTDKEVEEIIKSMVILVDTREKKIDHITEYFDKAKIPYKKKALPYGDYSFLVPQNESLSIPRDLVFYNDIVIERKGSLEELSGNLTKERDRLEKELEMKKKNKVLIIENANYSDVVNGNYKTEYNNKSYWASLHSLWHRYNIPMFFLLDHNYTGFFIRGYFSYYLRNMLK